MFFKLKSSVVLLGISFNESLIICFLNSNFGDFLAADIPQHLFTECVAWCWPVAINLFWWMTISIRIPGPPFSECFIRNMLDELLFDLRLPPLPIDNIPITTEVDIFCHYDYLFIFCLRLELPDLHSDTISNDFPSKCRSVLIHCRKPHQVRIGARGKFAVNILFPVTALRVQNYPDLTDTIAQ